jgi:hypothetical protein
MPHKEETTICEFCRKGHVIQRLEDIAFRQWSDLGWPEAHMKEVRSRLNRDYRLQNIGSRLQQNLTKAVLSGAKVIEQVLVDNLTETAAYKLEYDKLREYVFAGKRDQLWNVIPASIQTPQELQAFTERLQRNLNSRDRWI